MLCTFQVMYVMIFWTILQSYVFFLKILFYLARWWKVGSNLIIFQWFLLGQSNLFLKDEIKKQKYFFFLYFNIWYTYLIRKEWKESRNRFFKKEQWYVTVYWIMSNLFHITFRMFLYVKYWNFFTLPEYITNYFCFNTLYNLRWTLNV